jgi:hypothetical protein
LKFETGAERCNIANQTPPNQRTTLGDCKSRHRSTSAGNSTSVHHLTRVCANCLWIIDYIAAKSLSLIKGFSVPLKRRHPIEICIVFKRSCPPIKHKKTYVNAVAFPQRLPQMSRRCAKRSEFLTRTRLRYGSGNAAAAAFGLCSMCGSDLMGNPMTSGIAAHLPDEHFIVRVDGRIKSHHRRFLDALREGLQLRDQFPRHDVKVCAQTSDELHLAMTG